MQLERLMSIDVEVHPPQTIGVTPKGEMRVISFSGGTFDGGPDLRGTLIPGGTDWQTVRADGVIEIRAHYLLETDRGELIEIVSEGIRHADPGVLDRIAAGEIVRTDEYYFRTHVRATTAALRLDHLNRMLCVSTGERRKDSVHLVVYAVP